MADVLFRDETADRSLAGLIGSMIGAIVHRLIYRAVTSRRRIRV